MSAPPELPDFDAMDAQQRWVAAQVIGKPGFLLGARVVAIEDVGPHVWPLAADIARQTGTLGFLFLPKAEVDASVSEHLGENWSAFFWDVYDASPDAMVEAVAPALAAPLPAGWTLEELPSLTETQYTEIAKLNLNCGITPVARSVYSGEICECHTVALRDGDGRLRASASVLMLFQAHSPHANTAVVMMISVDGACRGQGLGRTITAHVLDRSHARFGWDEVSAFVASDNPASIATVSAAGLVHPEGKCVAVATPGGARFTR